MRIERGINVPARCSTDGKCTIFPARHHTAHNFHKPSSGAKHDSAAFHHLPANIALFTYARPSHIRRTLESLAANPQASSSRLVVFSDGPRAGDESKVAAVRAIVRERAWCGEVELRESSENCGLAVSIVSGVSALLSESESIIVLEDDLELSPGFLAYMNAALERYAGDERVMSVAGYLPPLDAELPETFLMRTTTSWGWATWRRAWADYEPDARSLAERIRKTGQLDSFNLDGGYDYFEQLRLNIEGRLKTWAVLWYASIFLRGGLTLHPRQSLVENIGHDHSGTHCAPDERFANSRLAASIAVGDIPVEPHAGARVAMRERLHTPSPKPRGLLRHLRAFFQTSHVALR